MYSGKIAVPPGGGGIPGEGTEENKRKKKVGERKC
jgi:hypothetical protein